MLRLRETNPNLWGAFDESGRQVLIMERLGDLEWEAREYEGHHLRQRGRRLVLFIGPKAKQEALEFGRTFDSGVLELQEV